MAASGHAGKVGSGQDATRTGGPMAKSFDVWFLAADTVYRGVPFEVLAGWASAGRVGPLDKVRPAGSSVPWVPVAEHPLVADYLDVAPPAAAPTDLAEEIQPVEFEMNFPRRKPEDDDDVDMIPLIDISLVLLIFFMMTTAVAALSPVNVPEMKHAAELKSQPDAITVRITKRATGEVVYAVNVGERAPLPDDNNLATAAEALRQLDAKLIGLERPPEVRIACDKELPRSHVRDMAKALDERRVAKKIAIYFAEVNEQK